MKISLDTPANRFLFSNELFDIGFFIFQTFSKTKKTKGHFPFSSYFEQSPLVRLEFDSIMNYIESPKNKLNSLPPLRYTRYFPESFGLGKSC